MRNGGRTLELSSEANVDMAEKTKPETRLLLSSMLCFVLINSVLFNLLYFWFIWLRSVVGLNKIYLKFTTIH